MAMQNVLCDEACHLISCDGADGKWEQFRELIEVVGLELLAGLMRLKEASKRKHMLEELAAEGDEAAAQEWWERYGETAEAGSREDDGLKTECAGKAAGKLKVMRDGESLEYGGKTYVFRGGKRWQFVRVLIDAAGEYAECGKGLKAYFSKQAQSKAFYDAAVEAEGQGRNGTGRYRLKI